MTDSDVVVAVHKSKLQAVGGAIRTALGVQTQYELDDMPAAIGSIGGGVTVEALSVTDNGTYTAPSGKAYSPVTVDVAGGGDRDIFAPSVSKLYSGNLCTYTFPYAGYYAALGAIDGSDSSTISYTVSGATVINSVNKTDQNSVYGSAAVAVLLTAAQGDTITITGTNIARQYMIVVYLTGRISSATSLTLDVKKDNDAGKTIDSIDGDYLFYLAGSTGDNSVSVSVTTNNTSKFAGEITTPVKLHKYGAFEGSASTVFSVSGTSYSTNYIVTFEVSV